VLGVNTTLIETYTLETEITLLPVVLLWLLRWGPSLCPPSTSAHRHTASKVWLLWDDRNR